MLISFVLVSLVHNPVDACVAKIRRGDQGGGLIALKSSP